ncbi:glycosyltransferase [Providencia rettgeri]|uniref:glycosyltransferase n=1 Tax=Providencia rettgeri TaxID=587 RepID=UPI001B377E40|nr:glycosyltransferase [Providencia rettgeri]MBQ0343713.1 glycosyltransferase [Providencia rettgeri]
MKVSIVTNNDSKGGAARAALRLLHAMQGNHTDIEMYVRMKYSDYSSVIGPKSNLEKLVNMLRNPANTIINKISTRINPNFHSNNILPSKLHKVLNNNDSDIINLHWIGSETMSINDVAKISKPIVWTLHDMWAFCGAEHVTHDNEDARWRKGYTKKNRVLNDKGFDLDRYVWEKKLKLWKKPMHIVTPSEWLANCAKESYLFQDWPISVIPNPIDTSIYKPLDKSCCRNILNLPEDKKIILFGAIGGSKNTNKGFDLLESALKHLYMDKDINPDKIVCVIFGQSRPANFESIPFQTIWLGHIYDDISLSIIYNSADIMVVPSRIENFPQSATEAQACGVPVVGFDTSGVSNAIIHNETGYLAEPFNPKCLSNGITKIINDNKVSQQLGNNAYQRAQKLWSFSTISQEYNKKFMAII